MQTQRKGRLLAFALGASLIGTIWAAVPNGTAEPVTKTVIVPDTHVEYRTKEVKAPITMQCDQYIRHVNDLRKAQSDLSKYQGRMERLASDIQVNVFTKDPNKSVQLQREVGELTNLTNAAWNRIGDASAFIDRFDKGQEPCR